jgi:hypothetical protein
LDGRSTSVLAGVALGSSASTSRALRDGRSMTSVRTLFAAGAGVSSASTTLRELLAAVLDGTSTMSFRELFAGAGASAGSSSTMSR